MKKARPIEMETSVLEQCANSNRKSATKQHSVRVEFAGTTIDGVIENGRAYVAIRPVAEGMGLSWPRQYRKLMSDPVLCSVVAQKATTGADGKRHEMLCLPEEFLPGWLFKVNADKVAPELRAKVIRYQRECYRVLHMAFTQDRVEREYRVSAINSKRAVGRLMTDMMLDVMLLNGKRPARHHFMNEHKLCNFVLTGHFAGLNEDLLNRQQLDLLTIIRRRNAVLIAQEVSYADRKQALLQAVRSMQAPAIAEVRQ